MVSFPTAAHAESSLAHKSSKMIFLFAWFCNKCLSLNSDTKKPLLVFLTVYLLSPFSFNMLIYMSSRVDFFLATAVLIFLYLFIRHRGTWYYYCFTLIILCIACLLHHIFCNIFFPVIFASFIYDIFTDEKQLKKKLLFYSIITFSLAALFFAIILFSHMNIDFETIYYNLKERSTTTTTALLQKNALYYEYYAKLPEHYIAYVQPIWKYNIARFVLTAVFLSPLLLLFWTPWILAIRHSADRMEKWCYLLIQISVHAIFLPAYMMAVDYDRWNCAYCFTQFCLALLLYYYNTNTFATQANRIICYLKKHFVIALLIVIYISSFDMPPGESTLPIVDKYCHKINLFWSINEVLP